MSLSQNRQEAILRIQLLSSKYITQGLALYHKAEQLCWALLKNKRNSFKRSFILFIKPLGDGKGCARRLNKLVNLVRSALGRNGTKENSSISTINISPRIAFLMLFLSFFTTKVFYVSAHRNFYVFTHRDFYMSPHIEKIYV